VCKENRRHAQMVFRLRVKQNNEKTLKEEAKTIFNGMNDWDGVQKRRVLLPLSTSKVKRLIYSTTEILYNTTFQVPRMMPNFALASAQLLI